MKQVSDPSLSPVVADPSRQTATLALRFAENVGMKAEVSVTRGGLLAIGTLVSSILLSSAVIVRAARGHVDRR